MFASSRLVAFSRTAALALGVAVAIVLGPVVLSPANQFVEAGAGASGAGQHTILAGLAHALTATAHAQPAAPGLSPAEAIFADVEASARDPADPAPHVRIGKILMELKRFDDALAQFEKAGALDPNSVDTHMLLAVVLRDQKRYGEAFGEAWRVLSINPAAAPAHNLRALIFVDLGMIEEAKPEFGRSNAASFDLKAKVLSGYGLGLTQQGMMAKMGVPEDHGKAAKIFATAVARAPDDGLAQFCLGLELAYLGKYDGAIAALQQAIARDPGDARSQILLGVALQGAGRPEEAVTAFTKAIATDATAAQAQFGLAGSLSAIGRLDEAEEAARKAVELENNNATMHFLLADVLSADGPRKDKTVGIGTKVQLMVGLLTPRSRLEEARDEYRAGLKLDPGNAAGRARLANLLTAAGQPEEALRVYRETGDKPANGRSGGQQAFGAISLVFGDHHPKPLIEANYEDAAARRSDVIQTHLRFGRTLRDMGLRDEAMAAFREVIQVDLNNAEAQDEFARLYQAPKASPRGPTR